MTKTDKPKQPMVDTPLGPVPKNSLFARWQDADADPEQKGVSIITTDGRTIPAAEVIRRKRDVTP